MMTRRQGLARTLGTSLPAVLSCAAVLTAFAHCNDKDDGTPRPDTSQITVECSVDLGLAAEDAAEPDWSGALRVWLAEARGDTLSLVRSGICGDECGFREDLVFRSAGGECPEVVYARRIRTDAGSPGGVHSDTTWAEVGKLKIQDWEPTAGVVSGELSAEFKLTFYCVIPGKGR